MGSHLPLLKLYNPYNPAQSFNVTKVLNTSGSDQDLCHPTRVVNAIRFLPTLPPTPGRSSFLTRASQHLCEGDQIESPPVGFVIKYIYVLTYSPIAIPLAPHVEEFTNCNRRLVKIEPLKANSCYGETEDRVGCRGLAQGPELLLRRRDLREVSRWRRCKQSWEQVSRAGLAASVTRQVGSCVSSGSFGKAECRLMYDKKNTTKGRCLCNSPREAPLKSSTGRFLPSARPHLQVYHPFL